MRPNARLHVLATSLFAVLALAACGGDTKATPDQETSSETSGKTVTMKLIALAPERITVAAGSSVTWRQEDAGVHTVTSGTVTQEAGGVRDAPDGRFDSGEIATGKTFQHTFADPGTYPYFCGIHPATMRGVVTVN